MTARAIWKEAIVSHTNSNRGANSSLHLRRLAHNKADADEGQKGATARKPRSTWRL